MEMRRSVRIPDRSEITADTLLSLGVAARLAFPDGSMSGLALRNAATRGDLGHAKLGGCVSSTLADIERMVSACWVKAEPRRCGRQGAPAEAAKDEEAGAALAGALRVCEEMRQRFSKKKS